MAKSSEFPNLRIVDHPVVQHKLTFLRSVETTTESFRRLMKEISQMLAYEVMRSLPTENMMIRTPLAELASPVIGGKKQYIISILRAGNGMVDGMLELLPAVRVGHIGLYRDPETLEPIEYYFKVPEGLGEGMVLVVDPMLATGNSATAAIDRLKDRGARTIHLVCVVAAPEGVRTMLKAHPDVMITAAALEEKIDDSGYVVPGLGDAGDRMFGTR